MFIVRHSDHWKEGEEIGQKQSTGTFELWPLIVLERIASWPRLVAVSDGRALQATVYLFLLFTIRRL